MIEAFGISICSKVFAEQITQDNIILLYGVPNPEILTQKYILVITKI